MTRRPNALGLEHAAIRQQRIVITSALLESVPFDQWEADALMAKVAL